eukprot:1030448-Pyramimonas_sp.AAC.1
MLGSLRLLLSNSLLQRLGASGIDGIGDPRSLVSPPLPREPIGYWVGPIVQLLSRAPVPDPTDADDDGGAPPETTLTEAYDDAPGARTAWFPSYKEAGLVRAWLS